MSTVYALAIFGFAAILSLVATGFVLNYLKRKAILDHPNERSSHSIPTPRGGGIAILLIVIPGLIYLNTSADNTLPAFWPIIVSTFLLASLSWLDDLYTLGPGIRFLIQIAAVAFALYLIPQPEHGFFYGYLPLWLEKIILGLGWVWFINLFNFMDGIDGISAVEIISITLGISALVFITDLPVLFEHSSLVLAGAALGFLKWNWHKAKVFMGDVGSVPLGFLIGWLLIVLAGEGYVLAAIILPLYYLCDATITLLRRAARKEKVWQAHREHFYQKATQNGLAHNQVVIRIALTNILLICCALATVAGYNLAAIICAFLIVTLLLLHLASSKGTTQS